MSDDKPVFVRDTRERESKGYKWRATAQVGGTIDKKLDMGDYSIEGLENIAAVERKGSASELLANMLTKDRRRFHDALERLATLKYKWIICDFSMEDMATAMKHIPRSKRHFFTVDKIMGSLASIMVKYGIPIIFCGAPRTQKLRNGGLRNICRGKDLSKKLLLKAHKYHGLESKQNTDT